MLLGVAGLVPGDWKSIDGAVLDNVAEHGFKTVQIRVSDPQSMNDRDVKRLISASSPCAHRPPKVARS